MSWQHVVFYSIIIICLTLIVLRSIKAVERIDDIKQDLDDLILDSLIGRDEIR